MKYLFTLCLALSSFFILGQRGEVPKTNPDNSLELKTVFQNYTQTTRHGAAHSTQKLKHLNLKVNNMYLEDGNTGISAQHFENYLGSCPKALNLSLKGLDNYSKAGTYNTFSNLTGLLSLAGAGFFLYKGYKNESTKWWLAAGGTFGGGLAVRYAIGRKSKSETKMGHDKIIKAFDLYTEECYQPSEKKEETIAVEEKERAGDVQNGDSNDTEKLRLELVSSNLNALYWTLGPSIGFGYSDVAASNIGGSLTIFKKGIYLNASAERSLIFSTDFIDRDDLPTNYGYAGLISIPLLSREAETETIIFLGQIQGLETHAKAKFINKWSLGIDGGIEYNQNIWDEYFVTERFLRVGGSYSLFTNHTYSIDDNRFKDGDRQVVNLARAYVHTLYSLNRDYDPQGTFTPPYESDHGLGIALGISSEYATSSHGAITLLIEVGKYPVHNSIKGFGGRLDVGYKFMSVGR